MYKMTLDLFVRWVSTMYPDDGIDYIYLGTDWYTAMIISIQDFAKVRYLLNSITSNDYSCTYLKF